jgi:hypothetical protein
MQDNRYNAPQADLGRGAATSQAQSVSSNASWFSSRPVPVFIIAAWCILQLIGISIFMVENWREVSEPVRIGMESPLAFACKFLYPLVLFIAGILLLFMRKAATYAFGLYVAMGIAQVFSKNVDFQGYLSLALVFGIFVYSLRLHKAGHLK